MVFFKKYYDKKVPKKYRALGKKINASPSMNQLAKRINYVKSLLNVEYKTFDSFVALNTSVPNISTLTSVSNILPIPQGTGESARIGNSIKLKRIFMRYMVNCNASATASQNVRIMLVRDTNRDVTQSGGTATLPTLGNILKPDNLTTGQVDNICAPLNDVTSGRYNILYNKIFTLDRQARAGFLLEKYMKVNIDVKYPVDAVNYPINGLYLVFMTDGAVNVPSFTGSTRVTFIDN